MFTISINLTDHSTAENLYVAPPVACRLIKADHALYTVIDVANSVITFSDGTTTIGIVTVAIASVAEGDCDHIVLDTTSLGKVALGPDTPLKIALNGGPTSTGQGILVLTFDEFHSDV